MEGRCGIRENTEHRALFYLLRKWTGPWSIVNDYGAHGHGASALHSSSWRFPGSGVDLGTSFEFKLKFQLKIPWLWAAFTFFPLLLQLSFWIFFSALFPSASISSPCIHILVPTWVTLFGIRLFTLHFQIRIWISAGMRFAWNLNFTSPTYF